MESTSFFRKIAAIFNKEPALKRQMNFPFGRKVEWNDPFINRKELLDALEEHRGDFNFHHVITNATDAFDEVEFNPASAQQEEGQCTLGQIAVPGPYGWKEGTNYASPDFSRKELEAWLNRYEGGEDITSLCSGEGWYQI